MNIYKERKLCGNNALEYNAWRRGTLTLICSIAARLLGSKQIKLKDWGGVWNLEYEELKK